MTTLGTLSIHLDGGAVPGRLRLLLPGRANRPSRRRAGRDQLHLPVVAARRSAALRYDEVAVAVSEPLAEALPRLRRWWRRRARRWR